MTSPAESNARYLTDDDLRRLAAMHAAAILRVFRRWPSLPPWSGERAWAEVRLAQARQELDAYNARVRRELANTRPDSAA